MMTHPGVRCSEGDLCADHRESRSFRLWQADAAYLGLVPEEESSGERRRSGHISKQGNSLLCCLLVEAAQATARSDGRWRNQFFHLAQPVIPSARHNPRHPAKPKSIRGKHLCNIDRFGPVCHAAYNVAKHRETLQIQTTSNPCA